MSLAQLAPVYLAALEDELHRVIGSGPEHLREYYAMLEYHLGWPDGATGKRIRPLLCLLSCNAVADGAWQQALPMAAAIELLHNFSLIHDDIQDNSPLRRGRPAVWKQWGAAQAINAGDAMFTLAHLAPHALAARGVPSDIALAALQDFDRTCLRLTQGQYLDMAFEQRERVTIAEYLEMIELKTAALIAAATHAGARLAEGSDGCMAHFYEYGRNLGLAFQIQDDLLGIWGDPALTGKSAASDLEQRKKNLPVVYGLEHSADFASAYARPHSPGESVAALARTLETMGARQYAETLARDLTAEAVRHLDAASPANEAGAALRQLTDQLLKRNQ